MRICCVNSNIRVLCMLEIAIAQYSQMTSSQIIIFFKEAFLVTSLVKNPLASAGDTGSIPGQGRSPEEGNGNPLQYSCLGNSLNKGGWWAIVHEVTKESDTAQCRNNNKSVKGKKKTLPAYISFPCTQSVKNLPALQETWV